MRKIYLLILVLIVAFTVVAYFNLPKANAKPCKSLNSNCVNASDHSCCSGLTCRLGVTGEPSVGTYKCRTVITPTPIPTPRPTPSPSLCPSPSPKVWCHKEEHKKCVEEERTKCDKGWKEGRCPSESPEPSPVVEPTCEGVGNDANGHPCGWSPPLWTPAEYKPSVCTVALPVAVTPKYKAISETSVQLTWESDDTNTTHWSVSFGYDKDNLPYGTGMLPKEAREITINGLQSNTVKWFELARWNGNDCVVYGQRIDP